MSEQTLVKKHIWLLDEFGEDLIKIIFTVKITNSNNYILEIYDSKGRHFTSYNIKYIDKDYLQFKYTENVDIRYQQEYNFEKRKSDVWIDVHVTTDIHILNQRIDENCLETILDKINNLSNELELLTERRDLIQKTYYPDTSHEKT